MDGDIPRSIIRPPGRRGEAQLEWVPMVIRLHTVPEYQLEGLAEGGTTMNLGLAGMTFGAAVTAAVTLVTVDMGVYVFAGFVAGLIATSGLTVFFGNAARRDQQRTKQRLEDIKAGRTAYPTE